MVMRSVGVLFIMWTVISGTDVVAVIDPFILSYQVVRSVEPEVKEMTGVYLVKRVVAYVLRFICNALSVWPNLG